MLTPADILALAADVIECNGLAHSTYHRRQRGLKAQKAPVCTLGAIAIAAGAEPYAWEEVDLWRRELASAVVAIEALLDFLGLDPEEARDETLGSWNDSHSAVTVIRGLRAAAREAARHELMGSGPCTSSDAMIRAPDTAELQGRILRSADRPNNR
jgi:hypothetical protein